MVRKCIVFSLALLNWRRLSRRISKELELKLCFPSCHWLVMENGMRWWMLLSPRYLHLEKCRMQNCWYSSLSLHPWSSVRHLIESGSKGGLACSTISCAKPGCFKKLCRKGKKGLEGLRQTLLDVVQARFPELSFLARGQVAFIEDLEVLRGLIVKMSTAQTMEQAQQRLLEVGRDTTGH
jgi:hypothetical protein